jgi:predicted MPP superfamily phosphohydrolase
MAPWQRRKQNWLKKLPIKPDLVINTGDNLGHKNAIEPVLSSLNHLKTPGVFVNGSNDMFAPVLRNPLGYLFKPSERRNEEYKNIPLDYKKLNQGFESLGWTDINNKQTSITVNGTKLFFVGTDDAHEGRADLNSIPKVKPAADLVIGVTHAPYLEVIDALDADIVFAGHTHGGQVCWPFLGRALVTNCDLPTKYARGLHQLTLKGKTFWLNVCAGLGHSIYAPVRLACRPEVRVITLTAKS